MLRRPGLLPGGFFFLGEGLIREGFLRNRTRKGTKDPETNDDRGREHQHTQILGWGQCGVAEDSAKQAEGCAAGAEREVHAFARTTRNACEPPEYGSDDEIDHDKNDIGRRDRGGGDDAGFGRCEAVNRNPKKDEGMNEGNHRALSIGENREVVHIVISFAGRERIGE